MQPAWIASTILVLAGIAMILVGHFYGAYSAFIVFGVVVLVAGIIASAVSAGLRNPYGVLGLTIALIVFFIAIDFYNLFGLAGWI